MADTAGRWLNGRWVQPNSGQMWGADGQIVSIAGANAANLATQQAQTDLAGVGTMSEINQAGASAADPFASQRPQYQNSLSDLMKGNFSINDPSYKFRFDQGLQAVERSNAAKGFLGSGNMLQELENYGQGMASTEYQNQYNRLLPLTGATSGSPGAAGAIKSGLLDSRNNALANLGAGMAMGGQSPLSGGFGNPFLAGSSAAGGGGGAGGLGGGGSGGGGSGGGGSGGGGGFNTPSFGGYPSSSGNSMGYDPAYSDEMLRRQLAAGGGYQGGVGGGYINAVPVNTGSQTSTATGSGDAAGGGHYAISNSRGPDGKYYITWSDGSTSLG